MVTASYLRIVSLVSQVGQSLGFKLRISGGAFQNLIWGIISLLISLKTVSFLFPSFCCCDKVSGKEATCVFLCVRSITLPFLDGVEEEAQPSHLGKHREHARVCVRVSSLCACACVVPTFGAYLRLSVCVHAAHTHTAIILHGINIHLCVH